MTYKKYYKSGNLYPSYKKHTNVQQQPSYKKHTNVQQQPYYKQQYQTQQQQYQTQQQPYYKQQYKLQPQQYKPQPQQYKPHPQPQQYKPQPQQYKPHPQPQQYKPQHKSKPTINIKYKELHNVNLSNPLVWGPAFWFSIHNGISNYPKNASKFWSNRMKNFIQGIPVMLPCEKCSNHAAAYIESKEDIINEAVKNKDKLFKFFVDFHNSVNKRLGTFEISLEFAKKMYTGPSTLIMEYKSI